RVRSSSRNAASGATPSHSSRCEQRRAAGLIPAVLTAGMNPAARQLPRAKEPPVSVGDFIRNSQVWKSIFRHPAPRDRRNRVVVMLTNVFLHLHPVSVRKSGIALSYTWCMGGLTFFMFLELTVTGVLLMFYYRPTLEHAYNDILALRDVATLGILRELHRWGAHAMVITIWLHMYRVFLTGS